MDARLQRRVQRYGWDKAASAYERYWSAQLEPAQGKLMELAALQPGERVLDVACGSGLVTLRAAAAVGEAGSVVGVDISEEMVRLLQQVVARAGLSNVTAERMDAEDLRLPDASVDTALCALGLMYVPEPRAALAEMLRVLRPGGRAVAAVWGARANCGWADIFPIVDARVQSEVCPMFFQLGNGDGLRWTMNAAGFTDIVVERISTTLRYASGEEACGAAFDGGPVALAYSRFDERVRAEVRAEYLASIEKFRRGERYDVAAEFVIASGIRPAM
ncbi:MAG: class I SAM-dependent methyltransferase [Gemmatimonadales bacterium]